MLPAAIRQILWTSAILAVALLVGCRPRGNMTNPRYQPTQEEAAWDRHHRAEMDDRFDEALTGYLAMCRDAPPFVRACYDYARLHFDLDRVAEGRDIMSKTLSRYPGDGLAQSGVKRIARSYLDEDNVPGGVAALEKLAKDLRGTEIHDTILFEIARLQRFGDLTDDEIRTLEHLISMYGRWKSQLWDDAIWRLAELYRTKGDIAEEKRLLLRLLDEKKPSWLLGSYTSPFHDDALLKLGELYEAEGKHHKAYEAYTALSNMKTSRLADSGVLGAARVKLALGARDEACRLLATILSKGDTGPTLRDAKALSAASCP